MRFLTARIIFGPGFRSQRVQWGIGSAVSSGSLNLVAFLTPTRTVSTTHVPLSSCLQVCRSNEIDFIGASECANYRKALCAMGESASGAVRSGCPAHLAGGQIAARGTFGVYGRARTNDSFQINKKEWRRRGESEYSDVLKTRKLLIFRHARNALASGIAPNWNVSGTRLFRWPIRILIL